MAANFTTSILPNTATAIAPTTRGRDSMNGPGDAVWILTSAFIIFTMISGFGLVESGMVSRKNEANIMVKNAVDVIFGGLGFWVFGYGIIQGNQQDDANGFSGFGMFFTDADETEMGEVFSLYLFQASFATTATTIVSGAVAERMNLKAYMVFAFTNTITYCFPAHWVWGSKGWLKELGVIDMGGASPVHLVGGVAGLVATLMLRPRTGRFQSESTSGPWQQKMASPCNVMLGMFMLWWGWLGFNCGSTFGVSGGKWKLASRSAVCTINSSSGGGIFASIYSYFRYDRLDIPIFMVGILGSLVSITAICGVVRPGESLAIGFIGAGIAILGWKLLEKFKIDDPVGAIAIHAGGSLWAMLAVGLFVEVDHLENTFSKSYGVLKGGHMQIMGLQLLACVSIAAWTLVTVYIQFKIIDKLFGLRLSLEEEILGADFCEHNIDHDHLTSQLERSTNTMRPMPVKRNAVLPEPTGDIEVQVSEHRNTQSTPHSTTESIERENGLESARQREGDASPSTQNSQLSSETVRSKDVNYTA